MNINIRISPNSFKMIPLICDSLEPVFDYDVLPDGSISVEDLNLEQASHVVHTCDSFVYSKEAFLTDFNFSPYNTMFKACRCFAWQPDEAKAYLLESLRLYDNPEHLATLIFGD